MIKVFIYCLLALGVGTFLSIKLAEDPGYVLISFQSYSIEATLVTMLLAVLIVFVLLFGVLWLLKTVNPLKLLKKDTWVLIFSHGNANTASEKGLQFLMLGHWQKSYKLLVENAGKVKNPVANYLAASLAAYQRNDRLSWTYCLDQAEKNSAVSTTGIKTLKALLEMKSGQIEQSLAILLTLKKEVPDSPYVLGLIKEIYLSMSDWEKLDKILPELIQHKILDNKSLEAINEGIVLHKLGRVTGSSANSSVLKTLWGETSKSTRSSEKVTALYLRKLLQCGDNAEATAVLSRYLKQNWSDTLVGMLGYIDSNDAGQQLLLLEGWVKDRPKNVVLMLTLGRVCLRNQLWGKAREYFGTALRFSKDTRLSAEINAELARLLENLGEHEESIVRYNKAMALMDRQLPDLPMPIKPT